VADYLGFHFTYDELAEVIKKYVKEAIHEYFRDMWREFEGEKLPYPPPPM